MKSPSPLIVVSGKAPGYRMETGMDEEFLAREVVDAAIKVHTRLGPGLLESAYETCLKATERLLPIHAAQLLSYLRLGGYHLGLLLNFNTVHMRQGIRRIINGYRQFSVAEAQANET